MERNCAQELYLVADTQQIHLHLIYMMKLYTFELMIFR